MTTEGALILDIDVGSAAPPGVEHLAADVFLPEPGGLHSTLAVIVCLPGGGMSGRYFDLRVPDELGCYSMARHQAAAGNVVITIDPPGVGDSDRPIDGYSLTPAVVADVAASATEVILDLTDDERRYLDDPSGLSDALPSLAAARCNDPLPVATTATSSFLVHGEPPAPVVAAAADAGSALLAVVGLACLVRGSVSRELAGIDVPVFLGAGEFDITGDPHAIPRQFPASRDITLFVLPDAGHNHNVAGSRLVLWARIGAWVDSLAALGSGEPGSPRVEARSQATHGRADRDG